MCFCLSAVLFKVATHPGKLSALSSVILHPPSSCLHCHQSVHLFFCGKIFEASKVAFRIPQVAQLLIRWKQWNHCAKAQSPEIFFAHIMSSITPVVTTECAANNASHRGPLLWDIFFSFPSWPKCSFLLPILLRVWLKVLHSFPHNWQHRFQPKHRNARSANTIMWPPQPHHL